MASEPIIDLLGPLGARVLASGGKLESGQLANMRLYRIRTDVIHTRLLGEDRTLCGRSLYHHDRLAWQFVNRGDLMGGRLPSGAYPGDRNACKTCAAHPVIRATVKVAQAQREAVSA